MIRLSKRLQAVADMVSPDSRLADVGTDHAYIPIYLTQKKSILQAVAMDIHQGPLERAAQHIKENGLSDSITTRLSDGVTALTRGEADSLVIAGMGGNVMIHILQAGAETISSMQECILQPQSEIREFRKFLWTKAYRIIEENMIYEDGKFYFIMKAIPPKEEQLPKDRNLSKDGRPVLEAEADECEREQELEFRFGKRLLEDKNPILQLYLEREYEKNERILQRLEGHAKAGEKRRKELLYEQELVQKAMRYFD